MADTIVVIGSGVVGLSCALKIQARFPQLKVRIVAEHLATDPQTIAYTSSWAGAHHVPVVDDLLQKRFEEETFHEFWKIVHDDPEAPMMVAEQTQYYEELPRKGLGSDLLQRYMPEFRAIEDAESLPTGCIAGFKMKTVCLDTPNYLRWLAKRFQAAGGTFERRRLGHVREVLGADVGAVVNCPGLGALKLGGVEDEAMYPTRGQTVLVRAPWLKYCVGRDSSTEVTYIIPRKSGDVIVGGTKEADDWHGTPRPETAKAIKERAVKLCPDLLPPDKRAKGDPNDLDVITDGCGLRPSRRGGIRCEIDDLEGTPLVHAYGHSGGGFQSSLGTGNYVVELLGQALQA